MERLSATFPAEAAEAINPFKGAYSYEKDDKDSFYGRDSDLNEVVRNVEQHTLSLLYSSSGVGKTSLIKAGLMPVLDRIFKFVPVYIRISDSMITGKVRSFSEAVIELIREVAKEKSIRIESDESLPPFKTITSFLFFSKFTVKDEKRHRQQTIIPVLIFDQFEELFSLRFKKANPGDLLNDLRNIIEGFIPDDVMQLLNVQDNPENQEELLYLKDELQSTNKWYRVLFSFREEYLSCFDSLKNIIPSVFYTKGRYHLEAFSIEMASEVIQSISEGKINPSTAGHLAKMMSIAEERNNRFREEVQPFILSLICHSLYTRIAGEERDEAVLIAIDNEDKNLVQGEILTYVENVFRNFSPVTRKFIEEELITDDGKRTMKALSDKDISEEISNDLTKLAEKSEFRILNVVVYFGSEHIEILHDKFLQPLLESRKIRRNIEKKEQEARIKAAEIRKRNNRIFLISGVFLILSVLGLYFLFREKDKVAAYNKYFKGQNTKAIARLKESESYNSLAALASVISYENSVSELPVYKNKYSDFFRNFNDSIALVFKNKQLVFTQYNEDESMISKSGRFRFSARNMYDSSMLFKIYRLSKNGYQVSDSIKIVRDSSDSITYSLHDYFIKIDDFKTSLNDSLMGIVYHSTAYLYNLFDKKRVKYLQPFDSIKGAKRVYFSIDNKFVIVHKNYSNVKTGNRIFKIISLSNKKQALEPVAFDPNHYLRINDEFFSGELYFIYSDDKSLMQQLRSLFSVGAGNAYYKPPLCYKIAEDKRKNKFKFISYNFQTAQVTNQLFDTVKDEQTHIEFVPASRKILVIHSNGLIYKYDYPNLGLTDSIDIKTLSDNQLPIVRSFVLNPDMLLLLCKNKFSLIELRTKKEIASFDNVSNIRDVVDAFYSPANNAICIVRENGIASFWHYDLKTDTYDDLKNSFNKLRQFYSDSLINANKRSVRSSLSLR